MRIGFQTHVEDLEMTAEVGEDPIRIARVGHRAEESAVLGLEDA
jgi:hypothetical protein